MVMVAVKLKLSYTPRPTLPELSILIECVGLLPCTSIPGGPLVFEVGYHPRKKIHVIRVVFQDLAMYARTSFRGAKTGKIGKKGMFLVI